eukprot:3526841-Amphidinium_carterae.1
MRLEHQQPTHSLVLPTSRSLHCHPFSSRRQTPQAKQGDSLHRSARTDSQTSPPGSHHKIAHAQSLAHLAEQHRAASSRSCARAVARGRKAPPPQKMPQ